MKIRNGFVSNSSTSSFLVYNKTDKTLSLMDFVLEVGEDMLKNYIKGYYSGFLKEYDYVFSPKSSTRVCFGDEHGNVVGTVFDYMMRENLESKNFKWTCVDCRGMEYYPPHDCYESIHCENEKKQVLIDFCKWLSDKNEMTTFCKHASTLVAPLIEEFCKQNGI